MSKTNPQFDCPCCGKRIAFDPRTGKAQAVRPKGEPAPTDLDGLLADQKKERSRLEGAFGQAIDAQRHQSKTLENLFEDAKKQTRDDKDKDKPPPRPWDLE